ncbi:MAG: beta-ketoacyl synthase N-terminal-like domain-containing protein [Desulfobacterales bacterium]
MGKFETDSAEFDKQKPATVTITDAAAITALGANLQESWQGILSGRTAIRPINRFPVRSYGSEVAACVEDLTSSGGKSMIHSFLNRLFSENNSIPTDAYLITATTKAGVDNLELLRRGYPADLQDILLSSITKIVSEKLGLTQRGINISASCASSTIAVARGAALIASGRTDVAVVCCVDLVTEFIFAGFSALKALSPDPCRPFDRNRQGLSLGEGAALLLLMSKERAQRDNRRPLATINGWGIINDATHITAPDKSGTGLAQAIIKALNIAKREPEEITAISAHGTGTIYNDLMEMTAFHRVFGKRKVPVYSVKGAIGHTLGAAGGLEMAFGLKSLSMQMIPPTVGLKTPMEEAKGQVSSEPKAICGDSILTTNSGFGGINAAIVMGAESVQ